MFCVGLTGGIGSGKSLACTLFASFGVDIIDSDVIARYLISKNGPLYRRVCHHFGIDILLSDGSIDRKKLRDIIFNTPHEKKWLENLMHPMIRAESKKALEASSGIYAMIAIPLLSQQNLHEYPFLNRVCTIEASEEIRILRTMERDHITRKAAEKIIAHQASAADRLAIAQDVVENNGDQAAFTAAIIALHEKYLVLKSSYL